MQVHAKGGSFSVVRTQWFSRYLFPSLLAIREGMVCIIPCLMISSFSLFIACIGEFFTHSTDSWVGHFYAIGLRSE
ncbi:hypothetical protein [Vibrio galatheae]|uniref:hypothetical protein n=1 Tax=Vibrio galatheae TaxID=579748 RepID=UPI0009FE7E18|nr:hypothetical protein [Vibrio galatheae]